MHHILHAFLDFQITPWKAVGFLGAVMFSSRWFVQFYATRKHKRVTVPLTFWVLSICGSILALAYFVFGKNDSVGIIQNLFPAFVAVYNLIVHLRHPDSGKSGGAPA